MPLYPYECDACGHAFDALQGMSEPPLEACPACEENSLRKAFGVPNARVRGSARSAGLAAEDNTYGLVQKLGREGAEAFLREKTYGRGGKRLKLPKGARALPPPEGKPAVPWFRDGSVEGTGRHEKPVDVTKIKDPAQYILKGGGG